MWITKARGSTCEGTCVSVSVAYLTESSVYSRDPTQTTEAPLNSEQAQLPLMSLLHVYKQVGGEEARLSLSANVVAAASHPSAPSPAAYILPVTEGGWNVGGRLYLGAHVEPSQPDYIRVAEHVGATQPNISNYLIIKFIHIPRFFNNEYFASHFKENILQNK